jgi:hypothetical protein
MPTFLFVSSHVNRTIRRYPLILLAGTIYCLGDAATVEQDCAHAHAAELFARFDADGDGRLTLAEFARLLHAASERYPHMREHVRLAQAKLELDACTKRQRDAGPPDSSTATTMPMPALLLGCDGQSMAPYDAARSAGLSRTVQSMFDEADAAHAGGLSLEQLRALLRRIDGTLRSYPATAQVAKQQGEYLAAVYNAGRLGTRPDADASAQPAPFQWNDLGMFAFLGRDEAVARLPLVGVVRGVAAAALWRGFETTNQMSWRNRVAVTVDMLRTRLFGRDISAVLGKTNDVTAVRGGGGCAATPTGSAAAVGATSAASASPATASAARGRPPRL